MLSRSVRELVRAVNTLTVEADRYTTNLRQVAAEMEVAVSTAEGRIIRAAAAGLVQYEPMLANTLRLGPGIVVHHGEIYRLQPVGEAL